MRALTRIFFVLVIISMCLAVPAGAALPLIQKAAEASLKCGCTTKISEGGMKVVVRSVSKSWQQDGKNCRTLRITVFQGQDLVYNGIQKMCEP